MRIRLVVMVMLFVSCIGKAKVKENQDSCAEHSLNASRKLGLYNKTSSREDISSALNSINRAIKCDSTDMRNYWTKLVILNELNLLEEALSLLDRMNRSYNSPELFLSRGQIYERMNIMDSATLNYNKALLRYDELLEAEPDNSSLIMAKINTINLLKDVNEALSELQDYIDEFPEMVELVKFYEMLENNDRQMQGLNWVDLPDSLRSN